MMTVKTEYPNSIKQIIEQGIRRITLFICLLFSLGMNSWAKNQRIYVKQYGIHPNGENMSPRVKAMLAELKALQKERKQLELVFEPGVYHFSSSGADVREYYISNHDQVGERAVGLCFEGFTGLRLVGRETEFRFNDRMLPIALVGCRDVELRGISIDFSEPQISQIEIIKNQGKDGGISFRPASWVKWRINGEGYFEPYGSNWSNVPMTGIVFNKKDHRTAYRISDLDYSTKGVKLVGENLLNAPKWTDERLKPGMIVAMRTYERPQPGIFVDDCEYVVLQNINVHYADGMGLLAQNSDGIYLKHFNVCLRRNEEAKPDRYFTTQADATHFSGCSGRISVAAGLFEAMMDDAINVHGFYLKMLKRLDKHTVEAAYMHNQAYGFEWGRVGDSVQFVYNQTFDSHKGYNTIAEILPMDKPSIKGAKAFRIKFEQELDTRLTPETGIVLENMRKTAEVNFTHNHIRNNRARGALFNTPKSVVVANNHFDHISGAAIVASTDCNQWFESGQTQYLHIHNNTFEDVLTSLYQFTEAVISLHPVIPKLSEQKTPFYGHKACGIKIENNVFKTFDTPLLYAKSVKGLCWRNNTIQRTKTYKPYHWNQEIFKTEACRDIIIDTKQTQ